MPERRRDVNLAAESRERLYNAAVEIFAERGYHGTTTRQIAARGGLSPAGIYFHHRSKAELLELVVLGAHEELLRLMQEAEANCPPAADSLARLATLVRAHVAFHASHQASARVANHELPALEEEPRRRVLEARARIENAIQSAVAQCVSEGQLQVEDLRLSVFGVLSLSIGVSRWFKSDGIRSPESIGCLYAAMVLRMLGTPEAKVGELKQPGGVLNDGPGGQAGQPVTPEAAQAAVLRLPEESS